MNQREGFYQVDTEAHKDKSWPYRITDAFLVAAVVGVLIALFGGVL